MSPLTISIAMTTYNGERFLQEQLDSFIQQSRLPDELIICDDTSSDSTLSILQNFTKKAPFPSKLIINQTNLGWKKNFEKIISFCNGDIIVFSDQDNVWNQNKLYITEKLFLENSQLAYIFHDAEYVNESLIPIGITALQNIYNNYNKTINTKINFNSLPVSLVPDFSFLGALLSFRTEYSDIILPFPTIWPHDVWIPFILGFLLRKEYLIIEEKLINFRVHSSNIGKAYKNASCYQKIKKAIGTQVNYYENTAANWRSLQKRLISLQYIDNNRLVRLISQIEERIHHFDVRANFPKSRIKRLPNILKELLSGRYYRHSLGNNYSAIKDILYLIKDN